MRLFVFLIAVLGMAAGGGVMEACQTSTADTDRLDVLTVPSGPAVWTLVWSDDFSGDGLPDTSRWGYMVGGHGWGNEELQYYTEGRLKNARVEDGVLIIEAHREDWEGSDYTSVRLFSKPGWTYGRFEVQAKLPSGRGTWPAIWMLPVESTYGETYWPDNGEIDIMEHVGFAPDTVHASVHTKSYHHSIGTQKTNTIHLPTARTNFHIYAVEWSSEKIEASVDGEPYFSFANEGTGWREWPFDHNFRFILNVAVGGTWGGQRGADSSIWPQRMEIDYVRVYKSNETE